MMMRLIWKLKEKLMREELSNEMSESESESETSVVASWWVGRLTVGVDACGETMPPNKAVGPSERQESTWSDKTYRETISEKFCARLKHCNR
jgi:hypothetical protein